MKRKWNSLLLAGLVLILATSVVACNQPATTTSPMPLEPTTIQRTPRTLTQIGGILIIPLKAGERVEIEVGKDEIGLSGVFSYVIDPYGNTIAESAFELDILNVTDPRTGRFVHQKSF